MKRAQQAGQHEGHVPRNPTFGARKSTATSMLCCEPELLSATSRPRASPTALPTPLSTWHTRACAHNNMRTGNNMPQLRAYK